MKPNSSIALALAQHGGPPAREIHRHARLGHGRQVGEREGRLRILAVERAAFHPLGTREQRRRRARSSAHDRTRR
jgi:hypothetical protein